MFSHKSNESFNSYYLILTSATYGVSYLRSKPERLQINEGTLHGHQRNQRL